ncbi:hypothetical protein GALMADRAFT_215728 [Galerina marginata CBS 339.88]|uniref:Uncharacterized protein n=1 Tax=Galerina marginata (strain CBS 339.88) TaxID=685588 RepID=A0A067SEZ9_GALM3|nr:hypothetical protein GALMADRAFT_215728 [Galerina marginata CBS 339.88]
MPKKSAKKSATSTPGSVPNPEAMDQFVKFALNELHNPPKASELFKIPEGLAPDWQIFFEKVTAYHERECAASRHHLISLEKRSWVLEDENISEFEMIGSAALIKDKGNDEFRKNNFSQAQLYYLSAISTFPTPDVLNNVAACALKLHEFDVAEKYATKALDMDLFTNPSSLAKARFRRASARLGLGNFSGALEDATIAHFMNPADVASTTDLLTRIRETMETVNTPPKLSRYLEQQPKPPAKIPFMEGVDFAKNNIQYSRIPDFIKKDLGTKTKAPVF